MGAVLAPEDIDYSVELQRANILKRQAEDGILKMVRMWVCQEHLPDKKELRGLHQDAQQYSQIFETLKIQEDGILAQEIDTALGQYIVTWWDLYLLPLKDTSIFSRYKMDIPGLSVFTLW